MKADITVVVKFIHGGYWTHNVNGAGEEDIRTLMEYVSQIEGEQG